MSLAPRPVRQHRSADWEKGATKILRADLYMAVTELLHLVDKVDSVSISPEFFPPEFSNLLLRKCIFVDEIKIFASY